ncbi:hypothetical protein ACIQYS_17700 [Psychrobacillus sp. NPDC096426]|uniref:hypothetical protein n=1 Tax=Psychrobacillus sp. NPDC096426 TaxID=3364491 RepID=UPI0037FB62F3
MKKRVYLLLFFVVIVLIPFCYIELKKNSLEKQVEAYLIEDKGYDFQEIQSIEGIFSKLPVWSVCVVFEDESDINYYYQIESGKVFQVREYPRNNVTGSFLNDFIEGRINLIHTENSR